MWQRGHLTVNHKMEALRKRPTRPAGGGEEMEWGGRVHVLIALRTELIKGIKCLFNRLLP